MLPLRVISSLLFILSCALMNGMYLFAQTTDVATPHIANYLPSDHQGHPQSWWITQDPEGIMYFANTEGVLQFDGSSWRNLPLPHQRRGRSVSVTDDGRIYAVVDGDFGYYESNEKGKLVYQSLFSQLDTLQDAFDAMIESWTTNEDIYFLSDRYLFSWNFRKEKFNIWSAQQNVFKKSYIIGNQLYVLQENIGLRKLQDGELSTLPGTSLLGEDNTCVLLTYNSALLIGRENGNFHIYKNNSLQPFFNLPKEYILNSYFQSVVLLPDKKIALATRQGIVIVDNSGHIVNVIDKTSGLAGDLVNSIYIDHHGDLWATLDNSISRIDISSPYTHFGDLAGLNERVMETIKHNGKLYSATTDGLYSLTHRNGKNIFKKVSELDGEIWDVFSDGEKLLVATTGGLYQIVNNSAYIINEKNAFAISASKANPDIFYVGGSYGVIVLEHIKTNHWKNLGTIFLSNTAATFLWLHENNEGKLWASAWSAGISEISFTDTCKQERECLLSPSIEVYTTNDGLVRGQENQIFKVNNQEVFSSGGKILQFNSEQCSFEEAPSFKDCPIDSASLILSFQELNNGKVVICTATPEKCLLGTPADRGGYTWDQNYFARMEGSPVYNIFAEDDVVWLSGVDGVARYDLSADYEEPSDFHALIRKVSMNGDSVVYYGEAANFDTPTYNYGVGQLRFEFSATSFPNHEDNQFQYYLEGLDSRWSEWTTETQKDYTHLPEGNYKFHLRAKNIYGHIKTAEAFAFNVLPPWYRTSWAYAGYVVLFTILLFGIVRWRSAQLERDKKALEAIVHDRTMELKQKNEELKELDTMKSRFFANISHEFRTPLTLILGPLEQQLATKSSDADEYHRWQVMEKNAKRLQQLINQLLDLSKLESGKMTLNLRKDAVFQFVRAVCGAFESLGDHRKVQYVQDIPTSSLEGYFDPDKLNKILNNLLSNAFKFTESYGKVNIEAQVSVFKDTIPDHFHEDEITQKGYLHIHIRDTGIGIKEDQLPMLFDRFYQVDNSDTKEKEGTGVGLALVKELVELHHGSIEVESTEKLGTTFHLILPIGKDHFANTTIRSDQIDPSAGLPPIPAEPLEEIYQEPEHTEDNTTQKPHVLLVEDHVDLRNYIKECLGDRYQYHDAGNGEEGLKKAKQVMPELIITDLMMPGMGGSSLCKKVKEDPLLGHIPVIMLTAKSGIDEKVEGLKIGADDYISKPFHIEELRVRTSNLIEQRKKLRDCYRKEINVQPSNVTVNSMDEQFLQKALSTVEQNMDNSDFGVEHLIQALNTSRTHLHRKLKAITGQSASEFIRTIRLKRAAQLLEKDSNVISQIGYEVGFSDHSYFTKCFKKQFNCSPTEYLARIKSDKA